MFVDADKNPGLVCLDADDYRARATAELQQTHNLLTAADCDPLEETRAAIKLSVIPLLRSLPCVGGELDLIGPCRPHKPFFLLSFFLSFFFLFFSYSIVLS